MKLQDYPRPANDNGIGIHFRLDVTETDNKPYISQGVGWLGVIHARWALVPGQDWMQIGKAASAVWAAGIMPVCRLVCKIDKPFIDWETGVKTLLAAGIPPYMQIFNEPGDNREWNGKPDIARFGTRWADAAARVYDAGGYPGVGAVLGQDEWLAAFNAVQAAGRTDIWNRAWFCVHNYGSNHPINYPYDDVNQKGTPVSQDEYKQQQFSLPIDQVNALRASSAKPGSTIMDDDTAILRFLEFKAWMVESLGYCLPMIGGEGGWEWGNEEDRRYSKLTPGQHADNHRQLFEWFSTGMLPTGDPLPDELFCVSPWIMADGGADDWWYGPLGTKQMTIDAVAGIPAFTRKFSWDQPSPAPPIPASPPLSTGPDAGTGTAGTTPATPTSPPPGTGQQTSTGTAGTTPSTPASPPPGTVTGTGTATTTPSTPASPPLSTDTGTGTAATTPSTPASPPPDATVTYVVQQGETLWGISRKFGTTVEAIAQANNIPDPNKIRAGQKLIIPR